MSGRDGLSPATKRRSSADEINFYVPPSSSSVPSKSTKSPISKAATSSTSSHSKNNAYLRPSHTYPSPLSSPSAVVNKKTLSQAFAEQRKTSLSQSATVPLRKSSQITLRAEITINMDDVSSICSAEHDLLVSAEVIDSDLNRNLSRKSTLCVTSVEVDGVCATPPPTRCDSPPIENPELAIDSEKHIDGVSSTDPHYPLRNPDGPSSQPASPRECVSPGDDGAVEAQGSSDGAPSSERSPQDDDDDDDTSSRLHPVIDVVKSFLRQQKSMYDTLIKPMADFVSSVAGSSRDLTSDVAESKQDEGDKRAIADGGVAGQETAQSDASSLSSEFTVAESLDNEKHGVSVSADNVLSAAESDGTKIPKVASVSRISENWEAIEQDDGRGSSAAESADADEEERAEAPKGSLAPGLYVMAAVKVLAVVCLWGKVCLGSSINPFSFFF